jgi:hypothetical protein
MPRGVIIFGVLIHTDTSDKNGVAEVVELVDVVSIFCVVPETVRYIRDEVGMHQIQTR